MKKRIIGSLIIVLGLSLVACGQKSKIELKKDVFKIEYGNDISLKAGDYVNAEKKVLTKTKIAVDIKDKKEGTRILDNKENEILIADLSLGTYKAKAIYEKEIKDFKIQIVDTIKPTFKDFKEEIKIEQNAENVDFTKFFAANDQVGKKAIPAKIKVDSQKVDIAQIGNYEIKVTAVDQNKNKTTKIAKVIVISLEEASKENAITKALDETVYENKKEGEEKKQEQNNNASSGNTVNSGGASNSGASAGDTNNSGGGNVGNKPSDNENGNVTEETPPKENVCEWLDEGISSEFYGTQKEVNDYASSQWLLEGGPHYGQGYTLVNAGCMPDGGPRYGIKWR